MGVSLPRPPRGVVPDSFYLEYAPKLYAALMAGVPAISARWEVGVEVADGGAYTLTAGGPSLEARPSLPAAGGLVVRLSRAAFDAQARDLLPRLLRYAEKHWDRLHEALGRLARGPAASLRPEAMAAQPGLLRVHYTDDAGDGIEAALALGGGNGPEARIELDDRELWELLDGGGKLTRLLVGGRVRVRGDLGYLVRLVGMLEP